MGRGRGRGAGQCEAAALRPASVQAECLVPDPGRKRTGQGDMDYRYLIP